MPRWRDWGFERIASCANVNCDVTQSEHLVGKRPDKKSSSLGQTFHQNGQSTKCFFMNCIISTAGALVGLDF